MTRVAYTSDLHVDFNDNNRRLLPYLVERARELSPEVLALAGDISASLAGLDKALAAFSALNCLKVLVPGNHDVWVESKRAAQKGEDSFWKYRSAIPEVCAANGFVCPVAEPVVVGGVAIVGSIGWYDYSLRDERLSNVYDESDYERGVFAQGTWNDKRFAVWLANPDAADWRQRKRTLPNRRVFSSFLGEMKSNVDRIPANVGKVLAVLHTAPFQECLVRRAEPSPFDAYEGSTVLGQVCVDLSLSKEVAVVCGHRHQQLALELGGVRLFRSPVGYLDAKNVDFREMAVSAVGEFTI